MQLCDEWGYLTIGLAAALPCVLLPPFLQGREDAEKPLLQRYWVRRPGLAAQRRALLHNICMLVPPRTGAGYSMACQWLGGCGGHAHCPH